MRDIMSNHELSLSKLQLLLYSILIAELTLIIFSYILIGFNFALPAQMTVVGKTVSAVPDRNLMVSLLHQQQGKMDSTAALVHWKGTMLSQLTCT